MFLSIFIRRLRRHDERTESAAAAGHHTHAAAAAAVVVIVLFSRYEIDGRGRMAQHDVTHFRTIGGVITASAVLLND